MNRFKTFIIGIAVFCLFGIANIHCSFVDFKNEFNQNPNKLEEWNAMANSIENWTDGLGMPIDSKIKETVIVLNLLGFKTAASCEGHIDWGCPHPWIDFDVYDEEIDRLRKEIDKVLEHIRALGK